MYLINEKNKLIVCYICNIILFMLGLYIVHDSLQMWVWKWGRESSLFTDNLLISKGEEHNEKDIKNIIDTSTS